MKHPANPLVITLVSAAATTLILVSCMAASSPSARGDTGNTSAAAAVAVEPGRPPVIPSLCDALPDKCQPCPDPSQGCGTALGLVCCGIGGCVAIELNSECDAASFVYWCDWGEQVDGPDGPDVICYD